MREWLEAEGWRFDFFQAVRLLEQAAPDRSPVGEGPDPRREAVRFKSHVSFNFPASQLQRVDPPESDGAPHTAWINFLGLSGLQAPLPYEVADAVIRGARHRDTAFRDFLDLFNHRLASLHYRVRKVHRVGLDTRPPDETPFSAHLYSLIGMGTPRLRGRMDVRDRSLLNYAGLLAQSPRSATGLVAILRDYFKAPVRVLQFQGAWAELEEGQRTALGAGPDARNNALGVQAVLGGRIWEQQGRFRLRLGPLPLPQFLKFLPLGPCWRPLVQLTRFYVRNEFDFDVQLELAAGEAPATRLGLGGGARLGWTTFLRSGDSGAAATDDQCVLRVHHLPEDLARLNIAALADLTAAEVQAFLGRARERAVPAGATVFGQGEEGDSVFFITQGAVQVVKHDGGGGDLPVAVLREGDLFGEMSLLTGKPRNATSIALEDSRLWELDRRGLDALTADHPGIERTLFPRWAGAKRLIEEVPELERAVKAFYSLKGMDLPRGVSMEDVRPSLERLRLSLFSDLEPADFPEVVGRMHFFQIPKGGVILHQGGPSGSLFILLRGRVRVTQRRGAGEVQVNEMGPGEFFGEGSFISGMPRSATVRASEDCEVGELGRDAVRDLVSKYPGIERAMVLFYHRRGAGGQS